MYCNLSKSMAFLALPLTSLSADNVCPVFSDFTDITSLVKAVNTAKLNNYKQGKRYTFMFLGEKWYMEESVYDFLTQKDVSKQSRYSIDFIDSRGSEVVGERVRCKYQATYVLGYDEEQLPYTQNFHMTYVKK